VHVNQPSTANVLLCASNVAFFKSQQSPSLLLALPEPIQIAMVATFLFDQLYIHRLIVRCMPTPADGGKRSSTVQLAGN
jgi:hypothetical protein